MRSSARGRGELEAEVMAILWREGETTVRRVHALLSEERDIAYTTVMTVMTRLARKKMLRRRKSGPMYLYRPALTNDDFVGNAIASLLDGLTGGIGTPVLSRFVDAVRASSPETLDELARLVDEKRKRRRR